MTKRAFLVGSQTGALTGVQNDVAAVAARLGEMGFSTDVCIGKEATRQGILARYRTLIDDAKDNDTVLIYYSGHGGYGERGAAYDDEFSLPRHVQFIVPTDIDESTEEDFRGITDIELSALLAQLTQKTRNVTVVLDCCHSAKMSRSTDFVPKALPRPWYVGIANHLKMLSAQEMASDLRDMESNPDAVRLVACAPTESAYEYTNENDERIGLLTESFLIALDEASDLPVSWQNLGTRVRDRVQSVLPYQRPEIEGPSDRLLFQLDTVDRSGIVPLVSRDGVPTLQGGRILGIAAGDVYSVMPLGAEKDNPALRIALATVVQAFGNQAIVELAYQNGHKAVPAGANAIPFKRALPKRPIRVKAVGEGDVALLKAIGRSKFVRAVDEDEGDAAVVLAEIELADGQLELRDSIGQRMVEPKPYTEENIEQTVTNLERFAKAQDLSHLSGGQGSSELSDPFRLEFGYVDNGGRPIALAQTGTCLSVETPVYVKVTNESDRRLYCSLFDVGVGGKITLLNQQQPSGRELEPGGKYVFGEKLGVGLIGQKLGWSAGVPKDGPRHETIVAIVSDQPQDLRPLEQKAMRSIDLRAPTDRQLMRSQSDLQLIMDQIETGRTRDLGADEGVPDVRYAVDRISFLLDPNPAPMAESKGFLIDETPDRSAMILIPTPKGEVPKQIAVRLKDLIVRSNRALFGTEVRIDTLLVTGPSSDDPDGIYRMQTARFAGVHDGDRLSFDNLLVYYGPAAHFVDMAIWVSRDEKESLSLAEMFQTELNSAEFKTAATALAALAVAAPQAAVFAGAVAASATLVNIGAKLLLQGLNRSIGLYRTSFLAYEQFGAGRHPTNGLLTAQDFAFSYEVIDVTS